MIGQVLNERYRVLSKLGEGGMGIVYLVEHVNLRRKEALKVLHPRLGGTAEFVARFRREARATNRLQHPNIVGVYDFGRLPDGALYLTTEFADGESLEVRLRRQGRLAIGPTLTALVQLAEAIEHAHARGVIHRDLKPANLILVEHRGHKDVLKVLDFGVAKIIAPDYKDSVAATSPSDIYGTPAYMSPEQIEGVGDEPRIDLYALGCIAFELLIGEPPFVGAWAKVIHQHMDVAPPRPSQRRPEIPSELEDVILCCLEKHPDRRYRTATELIKALRLVPGYPSTTSNKHRRSWRAMPREEIARASGFEDVETEDRCPTSALLDARATSAETLPSVSPGDAVAMMHAILRAVAEALVDRGCNDLQLTVGLADIANLEGRLEQIESDAAALAGQADEIERRGKEYEASLRFAIGELAFECDGAEHRGETVSAEVVVQLARLEERLAEVAADVERELSANTDRAITLAARRAEQEEALVARYATLRRLVHDIVPRFGADRYLRDLLERERVLRSAHALGSE